MVSNTGALPFLDFSAPGFSTRSDEVKQARNQHWCARTPYGLAILRHREVGLLLRDKRLRQGSYDWPRINKLEGGFAEFWARSLISQEGSVHRTLRDVATSALSAEFVLGLVPQFEQAAGHLAEPLIQRGKCEFMREFAVPFAGQAICILLGLDVKRWPEVAYDASDLGLALGVDCKKHEARFNAAYHRLAALSDKLITDARTHNTGTNYIHRLVKYYDSTGIQDHQTLQDLIVISIFGGVDTTKSQLGFVVALLAEHPTEWEKLKSNPNLVPAAIEESIRTCPTTTWATREAVESFSFQGQRIPKGQTLHMMVHASARDPLICGDPRFDIGAKRKVHFGFGGGSHHCIGHFVARTDMAAAMRVLVERVDTLSIEDEPTWLPETGNTSPVELPLNLRIHN